MGTTLLLLAMSLGRQPDQFCVRDQVDCIEVNHFSDESGRLIFTQVIYWDWDHINGCEIVRDFHIVKSNSQLPVKHWGNGLYVSQFQDPKHKGVFREVATYVLRETYTWYDPELLNREVFPMEKRTGLSLPRRVREQRIRIGTGAVRIGIGTEE